MTVLSGWSLYSRSMLAVCVVLSLIIAAEVSVIGSDSNSRIAERAAAALNPEPVRSGTKPAALQIPPMVTYREVVERPLFTHSRRPPEKTTGAVESVRAVQLSGKWKVTGIVVAGDNTYAHIEGNRDHKTVRLQVGMPLDGWKLEEIEADRIVLRSGDEYTTLTLHEEETKVTPKRR